MIDQFDERLSSWVECVVSGVKTSFAAPKDGEETLAVNLYLLELADDPLRHSSGHPTIQPSLRYLVTTSAGEPKDAHDLLGRLFYAARKQPDFDVELEPISSQLWTAFGIAPRPSFILRLPLPQEWPIPLPETVYQVEQGLASKSVELKPLFGLVLGGPKDTPLASAHVEMIALWKQPEDSSQLESMLLTRSYTQLERAAYTDPKGRFTLPGLQAAPASKTLLVRARGQEQIFIITEMGETDAPIVFRIALAVQLYGQVLGPDGTPLDSARVELIGLLDEPKNPSHLQDVPLTTPYKKLERAAFTDPQGRYILPGLQAAPAAKTILVRARGLEQIFIITETGAPDAPVVFRLKI